MNANTIGIILLVLVCLGLPLYNLVTGNRWGRDD